MKSSEIKDLIFTSLDPSSDAGLASEKLEKEGVRYSFSNGFRDQLLDRIFVAGIKIRSEVEFMRGLSFAFRSIAISGVAAIIFLLISIFIMEGKISVNSFLGLKDNYDESIVCLLTGK